jgi:hypothetical protein
MTIANTTAAAVDAAGVLDAADALGPSIAERAAEIEAARRPLPTCSTSSTTPVVSASSCPARTAVWRPICPVPSASSSAWRWPMGRSAGR